MLQAKLEFQIIIVLTKLELEISIVLANWN
jgi:hypothetical protein